MTSFNNRFYYVYGFCFYGKGQFCCGKAVNA